MRAFAASQFTLSRFGLWRVAVLVLTLLAATTLAAWLSTRVFFEGASALAITGIALALWFGVAASRCAPLSLRWDRQRWHLGPADTMGHEPWTGELNVVIDLGLWMLLRFRPDAQSGHDAVRWLPVQRRGFESQWHTLRCAVYSPRPAAGVDAAPDV